MAAAARGGWTNRRISYAAYRTPLVLRCPTTIVLCAHYPQRYLFANWLAVGCILLCQYPQCRCPSGSERTMDVVLEDGGLVDCWEVAVQGNISLCALTSLLPCTIECPASTSCHVETHPLVKTFSKEVLPQAPSPLIV